MKPAWKYVDQGLGIPALRAAMGQRGVCGVTPQGFEGAARHGDANAVCRGTQRFSSNAAIGILTYTNPMFNMWL